MAISLFVDPPIVIRYLRGGLLANVLGIFPYTLAAGYIESRVHMPLPPSIVDFFLPVETVAVAATVIGYSIGQFVAIVEAFAVA